MIQCLFEDEPDFVECMKCGENMVCVTTNYESGSWVVGYRCDNCHSSEVNHDKDPLTLLIKQSEELWKSKKSN